MSNLVNHARRELELLIPPDSIPGDPGYEVGDDGEPDPLNGLNDYMRAALLQLVTVFADQHHSGMSSSYVIRVLPDPPLARRVVFVRPKAYASRVDVLRPPVHAGALDAQRNGTGESEEPA